MSGPLRAGLTQTRNAFGPMPADIDALERLAGRMEEVRAANVAHHLELVARAAASGVHVLCLGELFTGPYFALHESPIWFELAEDAYEGPTVQATRDAAREHGMVLVVPIYELDASSGKRFNTAVIVDTSGAVLGRYRKTHIPRGSNERAGFHETYYYDRSDGALGNGEADVSQNRYFPVFATSLARIGIATCYDRHFPGSMRSLARNGAQLVFSPAVTFGEKARRMWELEFPVDAARHGLFIGGSNRLGAEPPWNVEFFGASYFCGPNGRVDPLPGPDELVIADLDLAQLTHADPSGWSLEHDSRPEIYSQ